MASPNPRAAGIARVLTPWLYLAAAGVSWAFAAGPRAVAAAAWLAPLFMLRWLGSRRLAVTFPLALVAAAAANYVAWKGVADAIMYPWMYAALMLGTALVYLLPYLAQATLAARLPGVAATLVFPAAVVTLEYALSLLSPLGTWNALAYTQYGDLPLMQLGALTGLYGVSFLVAWFAATLDWAWRRRFAWREVRPGVVAYAAALAAVLLFGGARLALTPRPTTTVRVAGVTARPFFLSAHPELWPKLLHGEAFDAATTAALCAETSRINDDLFARSRREARAGAGVVVWGEASAQVLAPDEAALVARGRAFAREENVWLGMGIAALSPGRPKPVVNKFVLVDPGGAVVWDYVKSIPVPGPEAAISRRGGGRLPMIDTPYGRVAGAICYDMDFPRLVRPAARRGADIMLVPSHDWRELDDLHARLAAFRAVESGFSLVRPDNDGVSLACDYLGRPLARADFFATSDAILVADVPCRGVRTPYAGMGDVFAWLCYAALAALGISAFVGKKRPPAAPPAGG